MKWAKFISKLIVIVAYVLCDASAIAQNPRAMQLKKTIIYSTNNGLLIKCINEVFQDDRGRLWLNPCENIGEELGINSFVFDGKQSLTFDFQFDEPSKVTSSHWMIKGQTFDGDFFGVNYGYSELFIWNQESGRTELYEIPEPQLILALQPHPNGGVLALLRSDTHFFLMHFHEQHSIELVSIPKNNPFKDLGHFSVSLNIVDSNGYFLLDRKGYARVNLSNKEVEIFYWSDLLPTITIKHDSRDDFNKMFQWKQFMFSDHESLFYLGAKNGFFSLDLATNEMQRHEALNRVLIKDFNDTVFLKIFFAQDDFGRLLINTARLNPNQKTSPPNNNELVVLHGLDSLTNYNSIIDQPGIVTQNLHFQTENKYFGSDFTHGINWISPDGLVFCELKADHQIKSFPYHTGVRAIAPLSDNTLFVNTDIFPQELNPSTGTWIQLYSSENDIKENGLSPLIVKDDKVWGSLWQGGLFALDQTTKEYSLKPIDQVFDKFDFINDDSIACFTRDGRLFIANIHTGVSVPFMFKNKPFTSLSFVNEMVVTDHGEVLAAARNGLWIVNLNHKEVIHHPDLGGFTDVNLLSITPSQFNLNELWLGSANHGVIVYDRESHKSYSISEKDGLSNNAVVGILEDENHFKWAATFHGINVIDTNNKVIYTLDASDGLTNDEYNRCAYVKLDDGRFVFGSIVGLDIIDPKIVLNGIRLSVTLHLFLNNLSFFSKDQDKRKELQGKNTFNEPIVLTAEHRYLNVDFALSEYANIDDHSFQYCLVSGAEKSDPWIDLGSVSELRLDNLPVGEYVVEIRGADHHAVAAANIIQIPIVVKNFFYYTWQFYLLVALVASLIVFFYYIRLLREKQKLDSLVTQRTAKIEKDKVLIKEQSEKIQNLYDLTTNLYTRFSHELKTPLTVIGGMADSIKGNDKAKKLIKRNAQNLTNLVHQILELKRIENKKLLPEMIQSDLVFFIKSVMESFSSLAQQKSITIQFNCRNIEMVLDFDPEKMSYILTNLLSNAIKYAGSGSIISVSLRLMGEQKKQYEIQVADDGAGIAEHELPFIFDHFYRAQNPNTLTSEGTGIGLAIVKELVDFLNGKIEVNSSPNKGTVFTISMPATNKAKFEKTVRDTRVLMDIPFESSETKREDETTKRTGKPLLLIIEDNRDVSEYLMYCLREDFDCMSAKDGKQGIAIAFEHVPDIIVSDLLMPYADGLEVCNVLKNDIKTSHIPIVLLSAKADIDARIQGLMSGADAYLAKPFNKEELIAQMTTLLNSRENFHKRYGKLEKLEALKDESISREDEFILKLRDTIIDNIEDEEFGVSSLTKQLLMSRAQIHNKVKALTNKSSSAFIRQVRIEKACELLETTDLTIAQVAYKVGISNPSYFSKLFAEEKILSPKAWRQHK